jgi:NAD(P)-dependent dehydrogenase (short-subunit alcohol dehydrogenase family)
MESTKKVWYVTGASKGLGLSLVKQLLAAGYPVAATSRNFADLETAVGKDQQGFLPLSVNLKDEASVKESIAATVKTFGHIDVVVNNAGYGLLGSLEELSDEESRANFEINVFGTLNVIRNAMPYLREQRSGQIFNISSIGGFSGGFPGFGIYCATKFAVAGLSESLAHKAKAFGVNVTVVYPGYFRTNFLAANSLSVPANQIDAYADVRASQQAHQESINGNQPGDPEKAVAALITVVESANPPINLFLGEDAYALADQKILSIQQDMDAWEKVSTATVYNS